MITEDSVRVLAILLPLIHLVGVGFALEAVWHARTAQGSTAWAVSLISFPYLSVPLYLIFGRTKFHGYVRARRSLDERLKSVAARFPERGSAPPNPLRPALSVLEGLAKTPVSLGNSARLLVDGQATFDAIFEAIENAKSYVLVQFFIARDDELGKKMAALLLKKAKEGVRCYYLFDEVGSHGTSKRYWRELNDQGVQAIPFNTQRGGWRNRFQINFRNHRKIVVVDGDVCLVGGHNLGDDYLGLGPLGPWRDTHVEVRGPAVDGVQLSFLEDWHWATGDVLELSWGHSKKGEGDVTTLVFPTGPSDPTDACTLMFVQLIQAAKQRAWISTPYFVPAPEILSALKLAALRGVDVRILVPAKADHYLSYLAGFSYIAEVQPYGVQFFRCARAFPHQKVVLIDDDGGSIGTANLDNRSLYLNFEISLLFLGASLGNATAQMLGHDFSLCSLEAKDALSARKWPFRLAVRVARLFAPIL